MTVEPWSRLAKLAPPNTPPADLQAAADRRALRADLFAAAADLWEEKAVSLQIVAADTGPAIQSATQDGVSVTYVDAFTRLQAQEAAAWGMARKFRAKAKPGNPMVHSPDDTPWLHRTFEDWQDWATSASDVWDGPIIPTTD